jgi:hypothetical protein
MGSAHQNNMQPGQSLPQILSNPWQLSQRTRFCLMEARIQRGLPPGSHLWRRPLGPQGAWKTLQYLRLFPHGAARAPARSPSLKLRAHMLLLNVALRYCRLPRESQVLKRLDPTGEDWTMITEEDLPLPPVPVTWRRNFTTTLTGMAQKFIPEAVLKVKPAPRAAQMGTG